MPAPLPNDLLVLRRGGLGDTLLLLPMLRALRRLHPHARLYCAGVREFVEILAAYGACDGALSSEALGLWALGLDSAAGAVARQRLLGFQRVFADGPLRLEGDQHAAWVGPELTVFDPRQVAPGVPFGAQLARQVGLAVDLPADAQLLPSAPRDPAAPVVLAPGSGGRAKCWPRARWLELAERVAADGPVAVVVGPTEQDGDDPRRWAWPAGVAFLADRTPLELARALAPACGFVGNDSGPTHLAAMLGVPTVAVFGPTDPSVWAPVGQHVRVVGGGGRVLADVGTLEVWRALA